MEAALAQPSSLQSQSSSPAIELKGTIAPVTVLCLRSIDVDRIDRELGARVGPAPQLFKNAPVVIDVAPLEPELGPPPLAAIVELVRRHRLVPVGVAHLAAEQLQLASDVGLAVVQLGFGRSKGARVASPSPVGLPQPEPAPAPPAQARPAEPAPAPAPEAAACTSLTVLKPVRAGQVVYAQRGDLTVVGPVNPGAQAIADGHVHVYGPLRGRALAGAHGMPEARVFCHSLEAELVSIAGEFLTADDIPAALRGRPAQIFVEGGTLKVAPL